MKTIWFTSDTHFGHKNIIKFSDRPFGSVEEMNETIIQNWNERVQPGDDVYHLGDVALCPPKQLASILSRLNGTIHLINGNHEQTAAALPGSFAWMKDYYELEVDDQEAHRGKRLIVLCHYAMRVWNASHHGSWHLYGHSHGTLPDDNTSLSFDIGVDCHDFRPLSYAEVKTLMAKKQWQSPFGGR